ncbi:FAD/NAD(P)-binding protein [Alkalihalobacterium bogoriense]|uniref:FAD/NAD(P)-binding protein n=1 Tax=Alkalihalobacterium bogoriense TaxID=246272 RepID=UPI00047AA5EC|nr:FAD/NAD(P)-binding protein [Alkalihalobacterium bogoriense]
MKEWTIIGGGIQGCTIANYLLKSKRTTVENLAIIDPNHSPLSTWNRCTSQIEMPFLRSPSIHHIDIDPFSLEKFAKSKEGKQYADFYGPYDRPSLSLFNHHCESIFEDIQLSRSWITGTVNQVKRKMSQWDITLASGQQFKSQKVVLAMGLSDHPYWPEWAQNIKEMGANIHHIFERHQAKPLDEQDDVVVIGGGISAVHTVIKLAKNHRGKIKLISRHPFRVFPFDSDPGWLGPKYMRKFQKIKCYETRRQMIVKARHRGSMPNELKVKVNKLQKKNKIEILFGDIKDVTFVQNELRVELESKTIQAQQILLATGFHSTAPGMPWLQSTIQEEQLRCATCGYPIVSADSLQWGEQLFVTGALSELEVGPVARNLSGARRAALKIVGH